MTRTLPDVRFVPIAHIVRLRRGRAVREAWTSRGRVLRRLGEPNAGRDYGSHQLAAVPQSVLHDGSPKSRDLLRAFRTACRSDTHVQPATFGTLRFPLAFSVLHSSDAKKAQIKRGPSLTVLAHVVSIVPKPDSRTAGKRHPFDHLSDTMARHFRTKSGSVRRLTRLTSSATSVPRLPTPYACQPRLPFGRQAGRTVIMGHFYEARRRYKAAPSL